MNKDTVFCLFANCIPVKGATRSVICDLQRKQLIFITNDLYDILVIDKGKPMPELYEIYGEENRVTLDEYFTYLKKSDVGFWNSIGETDKFPSLSNRFEFPYPISNCIIDIDKHSHHPYQKIINELAELAYPDLQFRFFDIYSPEDIHNIVYKAKNKRIKSISIISPYSSEFSEEAIKEIAGRNLLIVQWIVSGAKEDKVITDDLLSIIYTTQRVDNEACCGVVDPHYFSINISHFTEALHFNTCLNGKISIDKRGEIRNCPAMHKSFGHIQDTNLADVIENTCTQEYWSIRKDTIDICKNCEFRYVCTDCRAYTEDGTKFSKPAKCNYDPYTGRWGNS